MKTERYTRIPWAVLTDPKLGSSAIRVYGVLAAHVWQGNTARIGLRKLGQFAALSKNTVRAALSELTEQGHVLPFGMGAGQRNLYTLTSMIFAVKSREGIVELAEGPSGVPRHVGAIPSEPRVRSLPKRVREKMSGTA